MSAPEWNRIDVHGGVELAAWRTGSGRDPIVALHGLTTDHRSFDLVAEHLQHPGGMLAPDLRGRGRSARPAYGYGMAEHARDVIRLLDQEGIDRAMLVGHSMGGYVALEIALRHPERVSGIVLLDSGFPRQLGSMALANALSMMSGLDKALLRAARSPAKLNAVRRDILWMMVAGSTARQLARVRCPVALVRAGHGFTPSSPPLIDRKTLGSITACLPIVDDIELPGANHYTMVGDPFFARRVAAEIDHFQRAVGTPPVAPVGHAARVASGAGRGQQPGEMVQCASRMDPAGRAL